MALRGVTWSRGPCRWGATCGARPHCRTATWGG